MPYLDLFTASGESFEERIGDPEPFDAAVGRVALGFSYLEDALSTAIGQLLKINQPARDVVTSEMSFRNKMHLFASLVRLQLTTEHFNLGQCEPQVYLRELIAACFRCEEMRNAVMHSSWEYHWETSASQRRRKKVTAKANRGLHAQAEDMTAATILDIYDYTLYIVEEIEQFMLTYGTPADSERLVT